MVPRFPTLPTLLFAALAALSLPSARAESCRSAWERSGVLRDGRDRYGFERDAGPEGYRSYLAALDRKACLKKWTILVYMAADNDLAPYALMDLYSMEGGYKSGRPYGASTRRTDLLVQADTPGNDGIRRLHMQQRPDVFDPDLGKEHFRNTTIADVRSPVVETLPEEGESAVTDHAEALKRFIEWGVREYPSEHVLVIVWGHGQGWGAPPAAGSAFAGRRWGGIAFDNGQGTYLPIPKLREALEGAVAGGLQGRKIDVYASDACLMQMLEVSYELSGVTDFVIGSEQVQDFLGLPYRRMLYHVNTGGFAGYRARLGTDNEPYLMAHMIPEAMRAGFNGEQSHQGRHSPEAIRDLTITSLSSSELATLLVPALGALADALSEYLDEDFFRSMSLAQLMAESPGFMGGAKDLGGFLAMLETQLLEESTGAEEPSATVERLRAAIREVRSALQRTAIHWVLGDNYADESAIRMAGSRGLSLWLPVSAEDYGARIEDFGASSLYRDLEGRWRGWLSRVFGPPGADLNAAP